MTDLATLLSDMPWRLMRTSYGEAWIVTASGLPLARVEQEEVAGILLAGAELQRLAGAVQELVRAARRVTAIRLRFPTDSHLEPALVALTQALKPWPVGGEEPPRNTVTSSGGALSAGAAGGSSASADPMPPFPPTLQPLVFPLPAYQAPPAPPAEPAAGPDDGGGAPASLAGIAPDYTEVETAAKRRCTSCGAGRDSQADGHADPSRCVHPLIVNGRCRECRAFVERHGDVVVTNTAGVSQADGHAEPRPCRLIRSGRWCIEHNADCGLGEESERRHFLDAQQRNFGRL